MVQTQIRLLWSQSTMFAILSTSLATQCCLKETKLVFYPRCTNIFFFFLTVHTTLFIFPNNMTCRGGSKMIKSNYQNTLYALGKRLIRAQLPKTPKFWAGFLIFQKKCPYPWCQMLNFSDMGPLVNIVSLYSCSSWTTISRDVQVGILSLQLILQIAFFLLQLKSFSAPLPFFSKPFTKLC